MSMSNTTGNGKSPDIPAEDQNSKSPIVRMDDSQLSLKDVFEQVRVKEPRPDRAALLRWQARFPKYSRELVEFFLNWAVQDTRAGHAEPGVAEQKVAAKAAVKAAKS